MRSLLFKHNSKKPTGHRFLSAVFGICFAFPLAAQDAVSNSQQITLIDAVTRTLSHHPEIKALIAKDSEWLGRIKQAAIGDRAQIGLTVEDAMGTGEHSGFKSLQTTLTYSWIVQQAQIDSRVETAKSQASAVATERQIKALDLASVVAKQFVEILVKQERLKLSKLAVAQAVDVVDSITKRVAAGKSSNIEAQLAKAELVRRQLAVEDLTHELKASHYQLASLWGQPNTDFSLTGNLLDLPVVPSVESQLAKLKENPRLQQFVTEQRIVQSQIELARIEAKPQWQFTAGLRRYETTDDVGLVAGISIPWGNENQNAGTISALSAKQDILTSEQQALMQKLDAQLYVVLQEMEHSHHVIETVQSQIIPTLEAALSDATQAFDLGQLNYSQWSNVRRELISAQSQLLDAYESLHLQHIEIQRLTGASLIQ